MMRVLSTAVADSKISIGVLLLALLFFSWFTSLKSLIFNHATTASESQADAAPNILMIVVDDLGYDDISAINPSGLSTPNIQQLAAGGITFSRHYADSTCSPSRVAMLSGRYPERSNFRPAGLEIPAEFPTIAQQLQAAGYATYLTGKWHAGEERAEARPENKGFKQWFGFLNQFELSGELTAANTGTNRGNKRPTYNNPMLRSNGGELVRHPGHLTDILTEHSLEKLIELQSGNQPWFLYHAFLAPHHPIQPAERYAQQFPDTPEGKYTALVTQMDNAVGRLLQAIDRDNTLVVFVSDNGGTNVQRDNNFPFHGKKNEPFEGSVRTPLIMNWPGNIPAGQVTDEVVMNVDIYPTLVAAAQSVVPEGLDGVSLWNVMLSDLPVEERSRSWNTYSANVNAVGYSFLSKDGQWRLASLGGLPPRLFNLTEAPNGDHDVAALYPEQVTSLASNMRQTLWDKSLLAVSATPGKDETQTLYGGYDTMRTPYRLGFSIGLEIGPINTALPAQREQPYHVLAGQQGIWELRFRPDHGLEWHIGDVILRDPHFEPSRCNAVILTGYFEPMNFLAKREPRSPLKLYSSGFLRDSHTDFNFNQLDDKPLTPPTYVNFNGRALFSNIMLSSYDDHYTPRADVSVAGLYSELFNQRVLSIADVNLMDGQLCRQPPG